MCVIQVPVYAFRNRLQRFHSLRLSVHLFLQPLPGGFRRHFPIVCTATLLVWLKRENELYSTTIIMCYSWERMFFVRHKSRLKNQLIIANCRIKWQASLHSLRDIDPNLNTYDMLFIIDCKLAYCIEILTMLGGAVCRERLELWQIFGSSFVTVSEVTECSVSGSLWRKVEQQSIAALHTTLFRRRCHSSIQWHHFWANCLATVITFVDFFQPSTVVQFLYLPRNTIISILYILSLGCNCTAVCAISSFAELYSNNFWVRATFYHSSPLSK
jgi:hypothetical protein